MTTKKFVLPQLYFSKLMRAITEFELIGEGDKILLGISGGKDSIFMAYAMAMMQKRLKKNRLIRQEKLPRFPRPSSWR